MEEQNWVVKSIPDKMNASGFSASAPVQIGLTDTRYGSETGSGEATIANTTNTGSYTFTVPASLSYLSGGTLGGNNIYEVAVYLNGGGTGNFAVSNPFTISASKILNPNPTPTITSVSPSQVSPLTSVSATLYGTNLSGITQINYYDNNGNSIGNTPASSVTSDTATQAQFTISGLITANGLPNNATGFEISVTNSSGTSNKLPISITSSAPAPTPTIPVVTSPSGGQNWVVGNQYQITWNASGFSASAPVQIGLTDTRYGSETGSGEATIANTTNTGSYTFTVPASLSYLSGGTLGGNNIYEVAVYLNGGGTGNFAVSNPFTISAPVPTQAATALISSQISGVVLLLQSFGVNSTATLSNVQGILSGQSSTGAQSSLTAAQVGAVTSLLQTFGASQSMIANVMSVLPVSTSAPTPTPAPVTNPTSGSQITTTNGIPTIQIISPNGGETLHVGQIEHITWNSANVDHVTLGYSFGVGSLNWFANNTAQSIPNTGSYDWTVNIGNTVNTQIKIYAIGYHTGVGSASDYSDNFVNVLP